MRLEWAGDGSGLGELRVGRREFLRWTGLAGAAAGMAGTLPLALQAASDLAGPATSVTAGSLRAPTAAVPARLRPPATPLAVRSMYLSTWMPADSLPGTWPTFWNGRTTAITGLVRVDGTTYTWCGTPSQNFPLAAQTGLEVTATRSVYTLRAGTVTLTATFFSPVDPASLQRQCVPMSYLTVTAAANDGGSHSVSVYLDISAEWVHGDDSQLVSWSQQTVGGLNVQTVRPENPSPLGESGDQASWGTVVWATDDAEGLSWQAGQDLVVRPTAAQGSLPGTSDPGQPRAINDRWPVFGFLRDLGTVTARPSPEIVVCIGHVREPAVSWLGAPLPPLWTKYWRSWQDMLTWFRADLPAARQVCAGTDAAVNWWAGQHPGMSAAAAGQYAAITALALRQAFGGTELVTGPSGQPWAFLKEVSSSGRVSAVDVIFPACPAYLQLSPAYLQALLAPVLDYADSHRNETAVAPHDLGPHYPQVTGPDPAAAMPIEESGNMIMMAAAVMSRLGPAAAASHARAHYRVLRRWASYLLSQAPSYPGAQPSSDDFLGPLAGSVNLNLKGIAGIAAFSQIASLAGNSGDQALFAARARTSAATWAARARNASAGHLDLAYGDSATFSLLYNGYPDRLLGTNLVAPAIQSQQAKYYQSRAGEYGVPLVSGHSFTKADWEVLTAGFLYAQPAARDALIGGVYRFTDATPARVPFPDWYDTQSSNLAGGFQARPVVGGTFALNTLRYIPNGLTGYWPLDGSSPVDASGNFNDLELAGGAVYAAGGLGETLLLNQPGAHAQTARPVVRTDGSFTVMAWARLTAATGTHTALSQDGNAVSGFALQYSPAGQRWSFTMPATDTAGSTAARAVSGGPAAVGRWVHLAGVRDGAAGQLRLYVNGAPAGTAACTGSWQACGGLQAGRGLQQGRPAEFFPGALDEIRTYNRALSAAEIAAGAGLGTGLAASYPLTEAAGPQAADQAGGHTLQLAGATWGDGLRGPGLVFNGSAGAAVTAGFLDTSKDFTVSAWARLAPADGGGEQTVLSQDGRAVSAFTLHYSPTAGAWEFAVRAADHRAAATARATAPLPPRTSDWQHLAGVHDTTTGQLRLYIDGRPAATARSPLPWRATGNFAAGRGLANGQPARWFTGNIDQIRTWNRALTDTDISTLV